MSGELPFGPEVYAQRRAELAERMREAGATDPIVLLGKGLEERNPGVKHPFRQQDHIAYLTGVNHPDFGITIDTESGFTTAVFDDPSPDDRVWGAVSLDRETLAKEHGIDHYLGMDRVRDLRYGMHTLDSSNLGVRDMKFVTAKLQELYHTYGNEPVPLEEVERVVGELGTSAAESETLRAALIDMRLRKSPEEIANLEAALEVTAAAFDAAMRYTRLGGNEAGIRAAIVGEYIRNHGIEAFNTNITQDGKNLHQEIPTNNLLEGGKLLLVDTGFESHLGLGLASDITRVWPVSGVFSLIQQDVYEIVLRAKNEATAMLGPGVNFRGAHDIASQVIAEGLREIGVLQGRIGDILETGAHRLFFPHGLGHDLGMGVHDMQEWEDRVAGYSARNRRSAEFGLKSLRCARTLQPGNVVTVEPGIYFNSATFDGPIETAAQEFVNKPMARQLERIVSGIRLEDDVLITDDGHRTLGPQIPIEIDEIEAIVGSGVRRARKSTTARMQ